MRQPSDYPYDASDPFGHIRPSGKPHTGSDWLAPLGSYAYAIQSGMVCTAAGWTSVVGNYLAFRLPNGNYWSYIHLSEPWVNVGDTVSEGQIVALTGNTGSASQGPHLHCSYSDSPEVYVGMGNLQDPYAYLTTPQPLRNKEGEPMLAIYLPKGAKNGVDPKFAFFSGNFWLEFEGQAAANAFMLQVQPTAAAFQATKAFWDHCKAAAGGK